MRKYLFLVMLVMTGLFTPGFGQTDQKQTITIPDYQLGCRCDSVINADTVQIDQVSLVELQKKLQILDSLLYKIRKVQTSLQEGYGIQDDLNHDMGEAHMEIDSLLEEDIHNATSLEMKNVNVRISGLLKASKNTEYAIEIASNESRDLEDEYNAVVYPTKLLYKKTFKNLSLNRLNACRNAVIYKHGKRLVSLDHYISN